MTSATTHTHGEVARAAFDAIIGKDPGGGGAVGCQQNVDDLIAVGEVRGHEAVPTFFGELFAAFPDFEMTLDKIAVGDISAAVPWRATGTSTGGPFQGIL